MRRERKQRHVLKLRYLLYLVIVTTVVSSTTLARFATKEGITAGATIAAFVSGTEFVSDTTLDLGTQEALFPGETKVIYFNVTNFEKDGRVCEVPMDYEMQIETTGNLPLTFSLTGLKVSGGGDETVNQLAGALDATLCAKGGKLPSARSGGEATHKYTLTVSWPQNEKAEAYSKEIDHLSVKIKTTQSAS